MEKRLGKQTVILPSRPPIITGAALAGKKEKEGPLGSLFDQIIEDDTYGEESWEKAESHFFSSAAEAISPAELIIYIINAAKILNMTPDIKYRLKRNAPQACSKFVPIM